MIYYDCSEAPADITIGKDAAYYHPEAAHLEWSDDIQPFGYAGVRHFFAACEEVLEIHSDSIKNCSFISTNLNIKRKRRQHERT